MANKKVAEKVVTAAAPRIAGLPSPGGQIARSGLQPRGTQREAKVVLLGRNPTIFANVFGTLSHKVYGHHVSGSGPFQAWLGKTWMPEQLYGLGPAITETVDNFALDEYADAWLDGLAGAFPD